MDSPSSPGLPNAPWKELEAGTTIGPYAVERWLDRGGFASVYVGHHVHLGTPCVLKVVHRPSPAILQRLLLEGRVQSRLAHPNIVAVHDLLDWHGRPVLVMEYVDGPNLDELLRLRRLDLDQVDELAVGLLRGARAAHRAGLVHRDLKPSNVLLAHQEEAWIPKIGDFGLAKVLEATSAESHTRTGQVFGTPSYMSPEQLVDSSHVDARTDVFALGCIFYEMLTGARAWPGSDALEVRRRILAGDRVALLDLRPDAPERMARTVDRCLEPYRADRFASCDEVLASWRGDELSSVTRTPAPATSRIELVGADLAGLRALRVPAPPTSSVEVHLAPDALAAPEPSPEDAAHLAGCPRCRVARLQILRAEEPERSPDPLPPPAVPERRPLLRRAALLIAAVGLGWLAVRGLGPASEDAPPAPEVGLPEPSPVPEPVAASVLPSPAPAPASESRPEVPRPAPRRRPAPPLGPIVVPEPVPEPPPPPTTATWHVTGTARTVWLVDPSGVRFEPGEELPPGRYQIVASFPRRGEVRLDWVRLRPGEDRLIECSAPFALCHAR